MKIVMWIVGGLFAFVIGFLALERLAAERVEVVELHTIDEQGERVTTRLWIVDHEGQSYLRVGTDGSGWFSRLTANPEITLTRDGETRSYLAVPQPEKSEAINALMQDKYTWGDSFIGNVVGGRDGSIPIELQPVSS